MKQRNQNISVSQRIRERISKSQVLESCEEVQGAECKLL